MIRKTQTLKTILEGEIALFLMEEGRCTYAEVCRYLRVRERYSPYVPKAYLELLFRNWKSGTIALPDDQRYVVCLDYLSRLAEHAFPCGTVLYEVPIIFRHGYGGRSMGTTCFSASGALDSFTGCYVMGIRV